MGAAHGRTIARNEDTRLGVAGVHACTPARLTTADGMGLTARMIARDRPAVEPHEEYKSTAEMRSCPPVLLLWL